MSQWALGMPTPSFCQSFTLTDLVTHPLNYMCYFTGFSFEGRMTDFTARLNVAWAVCPTAYDWKGYQNVTLVWRWYCKAQWQTRLYVTWFRTELPTAYKYIFLLLRLMPVASSGPCHCGIKWPMPLWHRKWCMPCHCGIRWHMPLWHQATVALGGTCHCGIKWYMPLWHQVAHATVALGGTCHCGIKWHMPLWHQVAHAIVASSGPCHCGIKWPVLMWHQMAHVTVI